MSASNCPETPRQKMIQMMYLVYTAMLALNVSAEVVEGFKTVGNAMNKSNENLEVKLADTYQNFDFALQNNPEKVKDKYDKAQEIKKLSDALAYSIDTVIYSFVGELESTAKINLPDPNNPEKSIKRTIQLRNPDKTKNFDSIALAIKIGGFSWIDKLDNNHMGTRYFLGKAEGKEATEGAAVDVKKMILEYKKRVTEILGDDAKHVSLGLAVEETYYNKEGEARSWEQLNFNNTVAGAALVTLTRMKAETMNAEFDAVNQLYKQVRSNDFSFDKVAVITRAPGGSYIMKGGTYELVVNVGAYDSKAHFDVTVGGNKYQSNDSGAVVYKTVCNATGPKIVTGTVYVKKDDGTSSYDFKQSYVVAEPMAVFELTEMNVVYSGINNPVKISVPGTAAHDVVVSLADPTQGTITPDKENGEGHFIIVPKVTKGNMKVNAYIKDGKTNRFMGASDFRVRTIPDPKIFIGKFENGKGGIPVNEFRNMKTVSVRYGQDFAFHMKTPTVLKQNVSISKIQGADDLNCNGATWNPEIQGYVAKARPGCKLNLELQVAMPDGSKRTITGSYRIIR
jgi:hypothetical protein